jgi:hypothetical protein
MDILAASRKEEAKFESRWVRHSNSWTPCGRLLSL